HGVCLFPSDSSNPLIYLNSRLPSYAILNLIVLIALGVENFYARRFIKRKIESRASNVYAPVEVVNNSSIAPGSPGNPLSRQEVVQWVEPARQTHPHNRQDSEGPWTQVTHHHAHRQDSYGPWTDPFQPGESQ